MVSITNLEFTVFLGAAVALAIVPGPAVLYIIAQSVDRGRSAGVASVLGMAVGSVCHVTAAALGISVILVTSATVFSVMKYVGAVYLVYLGIQRMFGRQASNLAPERSAKRSLRAIFRQGLLVNVLNPKTALFFFSFLPQFVRPESGNPTAQVLVLGLVFVAVAFVTDSIYALSVSKLAGLAKRHSRPVRISRYLSGAVFILLGVGTALSGSRKSI